MAPFDNRQFIVNGGGDEFLKETLSLVFAQSDRLCVGWSAEVKTGLVLYWYSYECVNLFPCPLKAEQCFPLVSTWLEKYGKDFLKDPQPSHDGDNRIGWSVYVDQWGKVGGQNAICGIKPQWLMYGK